MGNVLARAGSFGSTSQTGSVASTTSTVSGQGQGVVRQGSQGSIFEQFTTQAKDLVNRQGSQDGLMAHMDKVRAKYFNNNKLHILINSN